MKLIKVEQYRVDKHVSDLSKKIELPSEEEMLIASLSSKFGGSLVQGWFFPRKNMFSSDVGKIRNAATIDKLDAIYIDGFPPSPTFVKENGGDCLLTQYLAFGGIEWDWKEHTYFAVGKLNPSMVSGNTSLLGLVEDDGSYNAPNLNIHSDGTMRFFYEAGAAGPNLGLSYVTPVGSTKNLFLMVVSQSKENGITFRFNGSQVANANGANAKKEATKSTLKLWGSETKSASFNGTVGECILCNEDLTGKDSLIEIENYLLSKYSII